ncbi:hypothetical protein Tco_1046404 [Tanacetum coccineum]
MRLNPVCHMDFPPRDQRHQYLRYEGLQYTEGDIADFEMRLDKIYMREVHRVQVFDFGELPDLMDEGLSIRMLMEHRDAQEQSLFTSRSWRDLMLRLCHKLIACSIAGRSQAPEKTSLLASGPERQPDAVLGAPEAAKDALVADEGALAVPAPVHAPQSPPPAAGPARTMAQRLARVEEDVHGIRRGLGEQREILDSIARDFS